MKGRGNRGSKGTSSSIRGSEGGCKGRYSRNTERRKLRGGELWVGGERGGVGEGDI